MPIYQAGSLNTAALTAPDLYVQVVPPKTRYINGVATDILGIVGVASWGPVNSPFLIGSPTDQQRLIGRAVVRKYDLATAVTASIQLGAANIRAVRVTDGTDVAASTAIKDVASTPATGAMLTAIYTGSAGNGLQAAMGQGTAPGTFRLTIIMPGMSPEVFDNISGTGATLWANLVSAVNNGQYGIRGQSQLVVATIGTGTAAPNTVTSYAFAGGTDGATTLTDATLIGADGATRTGMYALRGTNAQVVNLVDLTDSTKWPSMLTYGLSEGAYMVTQGPAGASYTTVSTSLNNAGSDGYSLKVLAGDWPYWNDEINGQNRMLAPATIVAAKIAAQSPHISPLNKRLGNVIGTQRQLADQPYSLAEIGAINSARLDVITNPCPGGNYFGLRSGLNTSSNPTTNSDTYTRMTNFISLTLAASFGYVVGENHTIDLRRESKSTLESFLSVLQGQGMIGDPNGGPAFSVVIDPSNNPDSRVALGYLQADVQVKYLNTVRFFLINLEAGGSVTISTSTGSR